MRTKLILLIFLLLMGGGIAQAQNITASGTSCATANACAAIQLSTTNTGSVTFTISGTFSATLQFEVLADGTEANKSSVSCVPPNSTTSVTSTTAGGTWTCNVPGAQVFRVRCSTYASGTAVVALNASNAIDVALLGGGGGGGSGTVTSVATTGPITGGTFTTSGTIACATCGVTGSPLSQFAATTSAQLAGVLSDETGTGAAVFGTGPTITLTNATALPAAVANTAIGALTGCGTATYVYTPQGGDCVAPGGSSAWSGITGASTNTATSFVSAPSSTSTVLWTYNCPLSMTVDCIDWEINSSKILWIDDNGHTNIQTLNLPGSTTNDVLFGNSAGPIGQVTAPATQGLYTVGYNPTTSASVAPSAFQVGIGTGGGPITGSTATYTVLYTDVATIVNHDVGGSASVNVTLPTATTLGDPTFGFRYCNQSAHADTITPTTWTIQVNGTAAASTAPVAVGTCILIWVDPNSATNWLASGGVASSGGITALTGDVTASGTGSVAAAVVKINGTSLAALGSGILYNTTSTGVPSIATSAQALAGLGTQTANTVLGALTATTPSGLAVPSCSTASSALIWTSGTGFGCNTAIGAAWSAITAGSNAATGAFSTAGPWTFSAAGAASTPGLSVTGAPYAGTGTASTPQLYVDSGTAPTTWNTAGTMFGLNSPSGYTGMFMDVRLNGGSSVLFSVDHFGNIVNNGGITASNGTINGSTVEGSNFSTEFPQKFGVSTNPTIASGFGSGASIASHNGTFTFTVNVGTGGTAFSGVITMPTASTGWSCMVGPNGTPQAAAVTYSAPTSATSITLTNYTATTGATLAWTASQVLNVNCMGY